MAKCHETESAEDRAINVLIPSWLKAMAGMFFTVAGAALVGAVAWAWSINATVTEMAAEIRALNAITAERFAALKERLDRERREDRTASK